MHPKQAFCAQVEGMKGFLVIFNLRIRKTSGKKRAQKEKGQQKRSMKIVCKKKTRLMSRDE